MRAYKCVCTRVCVRTSADVCRSSTSPSSRRRGHGVSARDPSPTLAPSEVPLTPRKETKTEGVWGRVRSGSYRVSVLTPVHYLLLAVRRRVRETSTERGCPPVRPIRILEGWTSGRGGGPYRHPVPPRFPVLPCPRHDEGTSDTRGEDGKTWGTRPVRRGRGARAGRLGPGLGPRRRGGHRGWRQCVTGPSQTRP